jgi:hypothetical protein
VVVLIISKRPIAGASAGVVIFSVGVASVGGVVSGISVIGGVV